MPYGISKVCGSTDNHHQSLSEVMFCKNCKFWHKDKDSSDVNDDAAWGECDFIDCGSYGSDYFCSNFELKQLKNKL